MDKRKSIINFNHIDNHNQFKDELTKMYEFYHKLWYCYKTIYVEAKRINLTMNLISAGLVATGTIVGGVTMNPVILGVLSGFGVLMKTTMEMKNLSKKNEQSRDAFTSYEKILSDLRNSMRGESFPKEEYLTKLKICDDRIIDMGLNWEKYLATYLKEYK